MHNGSLQTQLNAVFLGFLLLVTSSVAVTFGLVQTQQHDAAIINLAGRQRMLAQQMIRLALTDPANPELPETSAHFEQTLSALAEGGKVMDGNGRFLTLSPPTHPTIQSELTAVTTRWPTFKNHLQPPIDSAVLQTEFTTLLTQLDEVVSAFEAQAQAKITRLRWAQFAFLTAAFLILTWGYRLVHHQLLQPLVALGSAAQKIGAGNLGDPVPVLPGAELGQLGQTMETMRGEIARYQTSLEQQIAQRTQELTAAFEFSQEIVRQLDTDALLQSVVQRARDLMQGAAASVCVLDKDGRVLELVASSGAGKNHLGLRQSTERGIALPVIQQQKTVIAEGDCTNCSFLHHFPGTMCIAAPLQVGEQSLGALCVVRPQRPFDADEIRALTLLANAAAVGLENTRLIAAGKSQTAENASLSERQRLAAELHDNLAQTLGAINLKAGLTAEYIQRGKNDTAVTHLKEMQTRLESAYAQVRMALTGLHDRLPETGDLLPEVQTLLADFEAQSGLPARLVIEKKGEVILTAVTQKQALHILREALINIRRHAQASQVTVSLTPTDDAITLTVTDDGIGFTLNRVDAQHHLGLTIMRTRAERSHGELSIDSAPGEGTRITAVFPATPINQPQLESA